MYTDRWMMGDRYGVIVAVCEKGIGGSGPLYRIELDRSGRTIVCIANDCEMV